MFTVINPGAAAAPAASPSPAPEAPKAGENTISTEDALKGGEHTKMTGFTVSDLSGNRTGPAAPGSSVALGGLVQGKIMVDLIDALIPALIVLLFRRFKMEAKRTQFQLNQGEKNTLAPIVDACLNSINLDFSNPWTTLSVSMLIIYGGKALEVGGVQVIESKYGESQPLKPESKPAPVVKLPVNAPPPGQPPIRYDPKPATDTAPFTNINPAQQPLSGTMPQWGEVEMEIVMRRGKMNREKALRWFNRNWAKMGYQLPEKWLS